MKREVKGVMTNRISKTSRVNRRAGKGTKALNLLVKSSSPSSLAPHPLWSKTCIPQRGATPHPWSIPNPSISSAVIAIRYPCG